MKFKESKARYSFVHFMRATEELLKSLSVKEFVKYLEDNAELEDTELNGDRIYLLSETENLRKEFIVTTDGRLFWWISLNDKAELVNNEESMKAITITYDTRVDEDGRTIIGETCMDITVMEYVADNLVRTGQSGIAIAEIEKILKSVERLKGRIYIKGSIKDIREA